MSDILSKRDQLITSLLKIQDGRCAFCRESYDFLVIDHDHSTGYVRGLLCRRCNLSEGFAPKNSKWSNYRLYYPAIILGNPILYSSLGPGTHPINTMPKKAKERRSQDTSPFVSNTSVAQAVLHSFGGWVLLEDCASSTDLHDQVSSGRHPHFNHPDYESRYELTETPNGDSGYIIEIRYIGLKRNLIRQLVEMKLRDQFESSLPFLVTDISDEAESRHDGTGYGR